MSREERSAVHKCTVAVALILLVAVTFICPSVVISAEGKEELAEQPQLSPQTRTCLGCHSRYTPGIVQDWLSSRHSRTVPGQAITRPVLEKRITAEKLQETLSGFPVGCYECHSLNPTRHKDNFNHFGFKINVVVSPNDCSTCHPAEVNQYSDSKKAHAIKNLMSNPVYHTLVDDVTE